MLNARAQESGEVATSRGECHFAPMSPTNLKRTCADRMTCCKHPIPPSLVWHCIEMHTGAQGQGRDDLRIRTPASYGYRDGRRLLKTHMAVSRQRSIQVSVRYVRLASGPPPGPLPKQDDVASSHLISAVWARALACLMQPASLGQAPGFEKRGRTLGKLAISTPQ